MDRIEPIGPSPPPIDTTRVRRVTGQREQPAQQQRQRQDRRRAPAQGREWDTDQQRQDDEEEQDGRHRIDVRA